MTHHEQHHILLALQQPHSFSKEQHVITAVALLLLGCYTISFFDVWPTNTKRSAYETIVTIIPSPAVYVLQYAMIKLGRIADDDTIFKRGDFGNWRRKEEALQRIFGSSPIPAVLKKARTLSGYDKIIPSSDKIVPAGLGNWDNSCYQNSVLQALASLPAFQQYLHRSLQLCELTATAGATTRALVAFVDQLAGAGCQRSTLWTPGVLKSMNSWQQQDAQEYFSKLLDATEKEAEQYAKILYKRSVPGLPCLQYSAMHKTLLSDDALLSKKKFMQAVISNPMDGMQAQMLRCQTCGFSEGMTLTHFTCLTLNLGSEGHCYLEDLLNEYTKPELIDGVECDQCTKAAMQPDRIINADDAAPDSYAKPEKQPKKSVLRTKAKQITVGRLPKNFVFHVNRSIFDEYGNQKKNASLVRFPARLNFLDQWCEFTFTNGEGAQGLYELRCIVTHQGRHDNGHYVSYGKRDKYWYCFNDEIVTELSEDEVLSRGNVFMLFYEALDDAEAMNSDLSDSTESDASTCQLRHTRSCDTISRSPEVPVEEETQAQTQGSWSSIRPPVDLEVRGTDVVGAMSAA